jgi:hypothetical protein
MLCGPTILICATILSGGPDQTALNANIARLEQRALEGQAKIENMERRLLSSEERGLEQARIAETRRMIRSVLADTDFRAQLAPPTLQVGFDKGFFIRSADDNFLLKMQLQTQFAYIGSNRQTDNPNAVGRQRRDDLSGFEWERIRLLLAGHLYTSKLKYFFRTEADTDGANRVRTLDLWLDYEYAPRHHIRWGQMKAPFGRQFPLDDVFVQFYSRSLATSVFHTGRSLGVMAHGWIPTGESKKLKYQVGLFNGFRNQNDDVRDVDTNMSVAARTVLAVGSDWGSGPSDIEHHETPATEIGLSFAFNDDNNDSGGPPLLFAVPDLTRRGRGGLGRVDPSGSEYYQFGADVAFKFKGFSLMAEWFLRGYESETSRSFLALATARDGPSHIQGGYLQSGYFLIPGKLEAVARIEGVFDNDGDNVWGYAAGANYFIKGHALMIKADVAWTPESPTTDSGINVSRNDDVVLYRLMLQAVTR